MKYTLRTKSSISGPNYLQKLLLDRGIEDINKYLHPTAEEQLPFTLDNLEEGYQLLKKVCQKENPYFGLVVDCDEDGFCSAAIMYLYLKEMKPNCTIEYFLHTGKQHGLEDMEKLLDKHFDLLIVPDASSNDYEIHKEFADNHIPILILDHHEADKYSENAIVINNQLSQNYANKDLSGSAVSYKFCQYVDAQENTDYANKYIDLAAVGLIGDMMKLTHLETRYLCEYGLSHITNPFLKALIKKQSFSIHDENKITPTEVSFFLTPLVNALIRVGSQEEKEQMFEAFINGNKIVKSTKRGALPDDTEVLGDQVARICANARTRQNNQKQKAAEALEINLFKTGAIDNKVLIAIVEPNAFDQTLTGLIAMELNAKHKKPTAVLRKVTDKIFNEKGEIIGEKEFYRGSMRASGKGIDSFKDFSTESGLIEFCEGHANAAGWGIAADNLDRFIEYANKQLKDVNFEEGVYSVDFVLDGTSPELKDLILELGDCKSLWGQGMPAPMIVSKNIQINESKIQAIGARKDTLKFEYNGITYIKFFAKDLIAQLTENCNEEFNITIVGEPSINEWGGRRTPQVLIKDIEFTSVDKEKDDLFTF